MLATPARRSLAARFSPLTGLAALAILAAHENPQLAGAASRREVARTSRGSVDGVNLSERATREPHFWVSPDGRRFAHAIENGVVIDGQRITYLREKQFPTFVFSLDSQHTAFVAVLNGDGGGRNEKLVVDGQERGEFYSHINQPVFSPDSQHLAAIVRIRPSTFEHAIWIDGRESGLTEEDFSWELTFTSDSRRVIYAVEIENGYRTRETSVTPGEPDIEHEHGPAQLVDNFFFGPAGQVGYRAKDAEGKFFVVYEGREDPLRFEEIEPGAVVVSEHGQAIAYVAEPQSFREVVVANGRPSKVYGGLDAGDLVKNTLSLSADGSRFGYVVEDGRERYAVIDGRDGPRYQGVGSPVFSPDAKHVAYLATDGSKVFSVVDGKPGLGFDDRGAPVFSPDGAGAAYWAESAGKQFIVANGERQPPFDEVGSPRYSPEGKRLAYLARSGDKWRVIDQGAEWQPYDDIGGRFYFNEDGRHLAVVAYQGDKSLVVVDGLAGEPFDQIVVLGGGGIFFPAPDKLHYLARQGDELFLVEEELLP